jgi:hypothetical protein
MIDLAICVKVKAVVVSFLNWPWHSRTCGTSKVTGIYLGRFCAKDPPCSTFCLVLSIGSLVKFVVKGSPVTSGRAG